MPYSKEHKAETRQKILDSAIKLFSTKGFDQVSIDDLMSNAGLTRGAFYAHFKNKKAVYSKAIIAGAKKSKIMDEKPIGLSNEEWARNLLCGYISEEHINQKISPCPLAFLVTDIANSEDEVRVTYTRMYKLLNKAIRSQLKENHEQQSDVSNKQLEENHLLKDREQDILATTAMMIGAVAIGRALTDKNTTEKLLISCRSRALGLLNLD